MAQRQDNLPPNPEVDNEVEEQAAQEQQDAMERMRAFANVEADLEQVSDFASPSPSFGSWRWNFRYANILKQDNTTNPLDPFYLFYKTRSQKSFDDVANPSRQVRLKLDRRIIINNTPLYNGPNDFDIQEGLDAGSGPIRAGTEKIYLNWSYNGYTYDNNNIRFEKLQKNTNSPDYSFDWNDSFLSAKIAKNSPPKTIADSGLSYSVDMPRPFNNVNGFNMAQRLTRLALSSSMSRLPSDQESLELSRITTGNANDRSVIATQIQIANMANGNSDDEVVSNFLKENLSDPGPNFNQKIFNAQQIQTIIDNQVPTRKAASAAISAYLADTKFRLRKNKYVSFEFYNFESKLPFVDDVFLKYAKLNRAFGGQGILPESIPFANMKVNYNQYNKIYEEQSSNPRVLECQLPNLLTLTILNDTAESGLAGSVDWHAQQARGVDLSKVQISRGNILEKDYLSFIKLYGNNNVEIPSLNESESVKEFLNSYTESLNTTNEVDTIKSSDAIQKNQLMLLAARDLRYFSDVKNNQRKLPMSVEISFPLDETGIVGRLLFGNYPNPFQQSAYSAYTSVAFSAYNRLSLELPEEVPEIFSAGIESYGYGSPLAASSGLQNMMAQGVNPSNETPFIHSQNVEKTPEQKNNSRFDAYELLEKDDMKLQRLSLKKNLKVYNFEEFLNNLNGTVTSDFLIVSKTGGEYINSEGPTPQNIENLTHRIQSMISDHYRSSANWLAAEAQSTNLCTFSEVLRGRQACTRETLFYKVEKYRVGTTPSENRLVQVIFVPNTPDFLGSFTYTDTQVKYGEQYRYEVSACDVVYGSEFRYRTYDYSMGNVDPNTGLPRSLDKPLSTSDSEIYISTCVETIPNVKIVEYPVFSHDMQFNNEEQKVLGGNAMPDPVVLDYPPPAPEVLPIPLQGNYQQVLFGINPVSGEFTGKYCRDYVPFSDEEAEMMYNLALNQKLLNYNLLPRGCMEFKTDNERDVHIIQVFRTDELDTVVSSVKQIYRSFGETPYAVMNNSGDPSVPMDQATLAFDFMDTIIPNQKYYYTFRCVDQHGNISNPTPIYEIELYYNKGLLIPRMRVVDLKTTKSTTPTKKMIRYLEIQASDLQTSIDGSFSGQGVPSQQRIGFISNNEDRVEENNFLVRITSRDTGRKVGILIKFNKNVHITDPEDET